METSLKKPRLASKIPIAFLLGTVPMFALQKWNGGGFKADRRWEIAARQDRAALVPDI
jgi:hypothetical protein